MLARAHRGARLVALVAGLATAATLVAPATVGAVPPEPPKPSDQQVHQDQQHKDAVAGQVGQLSAEVAQLQAQITQLNYTAQQTEQKAARALQHWQQAQAANAAAKKAEQDAQNSVVKAQADYEQSLRDAYMSGSVDGLAAGLLTAPDPNALLQRADYLPYVPSSLLTAVDTRNRALIARSNTKAAAQQKENQEHAAKQAADQAVADARTALQRRQALQGAKQKTLASKQTELDAAKHQLAVDNDQVAAWNTWHTALLAEQAAAAAAKARAEAAAAAAARAAQQQPSSGGGSGGGGSGGGSYTQSPAPTGGSWTAAKGQAAVNRAMGYLGIAYAFAAGNASGPTYGVCSNAQGGGGWNDCNVFGFDCSGLVMYAWGINWDHYAATQYTQAGSFHPSVDQLLPGDLVFWSGDGTISGIGHVAIYIGNGNVIQAPYSGAYVEVTPLGQVESGYFGATRPLT